MSVIFTIFTENDWHLDTLWKCYLLCPFRLKKFQPNLFAQAQKFRIFEKKNSLWVSVVRASIYIFEPLQNVLYTSQVG